ncbi:MAG TPA: aldehyde dehydrogenase [Candidatus Dependentiae bacterium]|nr:aldehyde dehydrogenase [Candidatus Dependentiae bacterium]HRQ62228.1 aldehyde dehydrogenase [Candidatus Dependentiae bacterium]
MKYDIKELIENQHTFFATNITKCVCERIKQLTNLKNTLIKYESRILEALYADLHKAPFDAYSSEFYVVLKEINYVLKNIHCWAKPHKVTTPLLYKPARSYIVPEPYGVILIISPWNYPFQLTFLPLIGAIAAGNCIVIKPSEHAPHTTRIMNTIISKLFDPAYVSIVQGGIDVGQELLEQKFDYIFFTGSTRVGQFVMQAAAKHLTPLTLELGGKSPCIVHSDAHIPQTAQRLAWGKFLNAGQNCVAPDYALVHISQKYALIDHIKKTITQFFGDNPQTSSDYARIIDERHFDRLVPLLTQGSILTGGQYDRKDLYIEPTLLDNVDLTGSLMQEEIFGPLLPIITYEHIDEAISFINNKSKPIALYIFSRNKKIHNKIIQSTSSGNVGINDTILQAASSYLPFGGTGLSGFGRYHGKASFDIFSNQKSIFKKSLWFDNNLRYPPYGKLQKFIHNITRWKER